VKRRGDLIDQFADLVVGADNPQRLAERTLEVVMSLVNGRAGAVFAQEEGRLALFASRGIDQSVLDAAEEVWRHQRALLETGETFYVADRATERRLPKGAPGGPTSFAVVPVLKSGALAAVMYVDSKDPHFCEAHDLARLAKFSKIVAKAVTDLPRLVPEPTREEAWETYLERTPVEDMEREKLLLLLNRNEWNIARVARLMGVTRRTIYLRLARYAIPRERVRKTPQRNANPLAAS
jgi:hypothetical protein